MVGSGWKIYWNNIKPNNGRNFQNTKLSATDLKNTIFFHVCCYGFAHGWKSLHETVVYMMKWFISLKYDIFHDVWYRQSAADMSLDFRTTRSSWWMNGEGFTNLNPRSFFGIFSDYGFSKNWKIRITYRQWRLNFPRREREPKYERKNRKLRIQWR